MRHSASKSGRSFGSIAVATALGLTLVGCSGAAQPPSGASESAKSKCKLGMTQINQTAAFFTQMNEGATKSASAAGCALTIANANNDSAKQNSDIEAFVSQGVTGIIVVAIDNNGVLPAVKAARDKGIKVVAVDTTLKDGAVDTTVGVDNEKAGAQIGQWVVDNKLAANASYGVVDAKNSFIQNQREEGFLKVVNAAGAQYTQSVSGDNVQEKAASAAQNLLTAQTKLNFVYTTGEPATVGAVAALKGNSQTKIIGWDLTKEVIAGLDSGLVTAVVQQDPKQEGVEAVNELKSLIGGGTAKGFIDVPITIVTKADVEPYRKIFP